MENQATTWWLSEAGFAMIRDMDTLDKTAFRPALLSSLHPVRTIDQPREGRQEAESVRSKRDELVLVVDDNRQIRNLVREVLQADGYDVLTAANGAEGLHYLASQGSRIRLVLTDISMPGMNGFELADVALGVNPGLAILFMSGNLLAIDNLHGIVAKPFKRDDLVRRVREALVHTPQAA